MKTMKFRGFKAAMILEGVKTSSLRLFDDKNLQIGDDLTFINWDTGEEFAKAVITEVVERPLEDITDADLVGHEPFESNEAMYESLKKYYGDRITPQTPAKIVHFRLMPNRVH